eukprot:m.373209 g.373209  ORF g.373209 m.373209 type:complete len:68 (-) comp28161_c0_seq2:117-320(-)
MKCGMPSLWTLAAKAKAAIAGKMSLTDSLPLHRAHTAQAPAQGNPEVGTTVYLAAIQLLRLGVLRLR